MNKRTLLIGSASLPLVLAGAAASEQRGHPMITPAELNRRFAEEQAKALAALPFERVEVAGTDALAAGERLGASGRGYPVVVGNLGVTTIADDFVSRQRSTRDILKAASRVEHPRGLVEHEAELLRQAREIASQRAGSVFDDGLPPPGTDPIYDALRAFAKEWEARSAVPATWPSGEPEVGSWPDEPYSMTGLALAANDEGRPPAFVYTFLIPTDEGASVPAYLNWGGWNHSPPPEYHVAALRSWHARYGAVLVGLDGAEAMEVRVARRPASREEALIVAREVYAYCDRFNGLQTGTLAPVAASLMASDWWRFEWVN